MMDSYYVAECPLCGQGLLIVVKNPETGQLLLICDDCESQWRSPEEALSYKNALPRDEVRRVEAATFEEITRAGWAELAKPFY